MPEHVLTPEVEIITNGVAAAVGRPPRAEDRRG